MNDDIPDVPEVPKEIIRAVNRNELVVFVGAGVSRLLNCSGWDQLAQKLISEFQKEIDANGNNILKFQEAEQIKSIKDHRKIITIMKFLYEENKLYEKLVDIFKEAIMFGKETSNTIYADIYKLRGICITTNIDKHLDIFYNEKNIIYQNSKFNTDDISIDNLYKIHGSIDDFDNIVFTLQDYFKKYDGEFLSFIKNIFQNYTVLFIGYGLSEYELLEHLFTKAKIAGVDKKSEKKRFILQPYYSYQKEFLKFDRQYYSYMGIEILPFNKDNLGYEQLKPLLKEWNKVINISSNYKLDLKENIENFIKTYGNQ